MADVSSTTTDTHPGRTTAAGIVLAATAPQRGYEIVSDTVIDGVWQRTPEHPDGSEIIVRTKVEP